MGDRTNEFFETISTWIGIPAILGLVAYFLFWVGPTVTWYAAEYEVPTSAVHVAPKPTDCDFWHAPVGFKDCHYEKWVMAHHAPGTGKAEYRYDPQTDRLIDLRTNEEATEPLRPSEPDPKAKYDSVYVSWEKKSD